MIKEHNRVSVIKFKRQYEEIISQNPEFFSEDILDRFGLQDFSVVCVDGKSYLHVKRRIQMTGKLVDSHTAVYELDSAARIKPKMYCSIARHITNIKPSLG